MKPNEIVTIYVAYAQGNGGKRRPVLIVGVYPKTFLLYRMTTKYIDKSRRIQAQYYPLKDWRTSGLI